jgi:hypothetical protein
MTYLSEKVRKKNMKSKIAGECFPLIQLTPVVFKMVSEAVWDKHPTIQFPSVLFSVFVYENGLNI